MPKRVGGHGELFRQLLSDENLLRAIDEVNASHRWRTHHRPNPCTAWVEETKPERVIALRQIIVNGFEANPPRKSRRYDVSARKWRTICEPLQWPDQYIHHALIQVLQPVFMRGMDYWCCGSIRGRGPHRARKAIERWMDTDPKGTKYEMSGDIYHFYDSLKPEIVLRRLKRLIKDRRVLDLIWRIIKDGILIGYYTSQWFANVVLQPLDRMIRNSGLAKYYTRYMDNLTILGPNLRKLQRLRKLIVNWLKGQLLELKGNWQVFPTADRTKAVPLKNGRNGCERPKHRLPDAVGYRYGRGYTLVRKRNLFLIKRKLARYRKRKRNHRRILVGAARSLISSLGQIKHCNNYNLYRMLYKGERVVRDLKRIIRRDSRKECITWSMYLEQRAQEKRSKSKAQLTPA